MKRLLNFVIDRAITSPLIAHRRHVERFRVTTPLTVGLICIFIG